MQPNWWTQNGFIDPIGSNIEEVREQTDRQIEEEEDDNETE
jgi:hypothetical protein